MNLSFDAQLQDTRIVKTDHARIKAESLKWKTLRDPSF